MKKSKLKQSDSILHILFFPFTVIYWIGTLFAFITFYCNTLWEEWDEQYDKQQSKVG